MIWLDTWYAVDWVVVSLATGFGIGLGLRWLKSYFRMKYDGSPFIW